MSLIQVKLLGTFSISIDSQSVANFPTDKAKALFIYLALDADQPKSRTVLAGLLWPELPESTARTNLRNTLHRLCSTLNATTPNVCQDLLTINRQTIQFNSASADVDALSFQQQVNFVATHAHDSLETCRQCWSHLSQAAAHYQGELLPGFGLTDSQQFEEWLLLRREILHHQAIHAFEDLVSVLEAQGELPQAHETALRLLTLDQYREKAHCHVMRLLARMGMSNQARKQYDRLTEIFKADLGIAPSPQTVDLINQISAGRFLSSAPPAAEQSDADVTLPSSAPAYSLTEYPGAPPNRDWNETPVVGLFLGRSAEYAQLRRWIVEDKAQVITLLGMGGAGKSTLAAYTARSLSTHFDRVIWRSLVNAPPLSDLIPALLNHLAPSPPDNIPADLDGRLGLLLSHMRRQRCLLVLDNMETILRKDAAGHFRHGYMDYGQLLQQFGEFEHQSCLLITSRERPMPMERLEHRFSQIHSLTLPPLSSDAVEEILAMHGLSVTRKVAAQLTERYSGNPLALSLLVHTIQDLYFGEVEEFLLEAMPIFDDIRDVLDEQIARLSPQEQEILYWLAVTGQPMMPSDFQRRLIHRASQREIVATLQGLRRRSLMERTAQGFILQNVISEYLSERLIETICQELTPSARNEPRRQLRVTNQFALQHTDAQEYIRQSQRRRFLEPIADFLQSSAPLASVRDFLQQALADLRAETELPPGYAAGNLLNLLLHMKVDITGFDFSGLSVWHGDTQGYFLRSVDFSRADLTDTRFSEAFGFVWVVAYSPDGRYFCAGTSDGKIRFWRGGSAEPVAVWPVHSSAVYTLAFSPDGQFLASGSADGSIHLWALDDVAAHPKPVPRMVLSGHRGAVQKVVFSPQATHPGVGQPDYDHPKLVSASDDRTLHIWDLSTGKVLHILTGHTDFVTAACISPDGRLLVSGSRDLTIRLWDMTSGAGQGLIRAHDGWVTEVAFDRSGKRLASASEDATIRIWDVDLLKTVLLAERGLPGELSGYERAAQRTRSGKVAPTRILEGSKGGIQAIAFCPDGTTLASGGNDMTVRVWDLATGSLRFLLTGHTNWVRALAFRPDGSALLSGSWDNTVRLWDTTNGQTLRSIQGYAPHSMGITFTQDGRTLIAGNSDKTITEWDVNTGTIQRTLHGHDGFVWRVSISPDDTLLASASYDGTIRLWQRQSGQSVLRLLVPGTVQSVCFSPDGELLAAGDEDGTVLLWQISSMFGQYTAKPVYHLDKSKNGHTNWIISVRFSPDGRILASASADHTIKFWDVKSGVLLRTLQGHNSGIQEIAFSPDGRQIASAGWDWTALLWQVADGEVLHVLHGHTDLVQGIAFSPDGQTLATSSYDQSVRLWDVASGSEKAVLCGHTDWVYYLAFSPVEPLLASCSGDGTIKIWSLASGACVQSWRHPGPYAGMKLHLATGITQAQRSALLALGAAD